MNEQTQLRIGTRGSALALWQAEWVKAQLLAAHEELAVELLVIKTTGDKILDVPLAKVGGKGLFVKEIEEALLDGKVDLAVHSVKDMPAELPDGLHLAVMPSREDSRDALISRNGAGLEALPHGARMGTSSLRRAAQLLHLRPDLRIETLRGNVDTRLRKLESEGFDAIVLAAAGLKRMELSHVVSEYLEPERMLPAVGQGALGIETRTGDAFTNEMVASLAHPETMTIVSAERAFLKRLEGGCQVPIGAFAEVDNGEVEVTGLVASIDGKVVLKESLKGPSEEAQQLGTQLANKLLDMGARDILAEVYEQE